MIEKAADYLNYQYFVKEMRSKDFHKQTELLKVGTAQDLVER